MTILRQTNLTTKQNQRKIKIKLKKTGSQQSIKNVTHWKSTHWKSWLPGKHLIKFFFIGELSRI